MINIFLTWLLIIKIIRLLRKNKLVMCITLKNLFKKLIILATII